MSNYPPDWNLRETGDLEYFVFCRSARQALVFVDTQKYLLNEVLAQHLLTG